MTRSVTARSSIAVSDPALARSTVVDLAVPGRLEAPARSLRDLGRFVAALPDVREGRAGLDRLRALVHRDPSAS